MKNKLSKLLILILVFLMVFEFIGSSSISYAATEDESFNNAANFVVNAVGGIISIVIWIPKACFILIAYLMDVILMKALASEGVAEGFTDSLDRLVTPMDIFFNKFKLFDVNVFDLTVDTSSVAYKVRESIATWYVFFRNISAALLLVILIYVGIRMALSTVASQEAKYKKMLVDWVASLVLIFVIQYFAIFVIYANNAVVAALEAMFDNNNNSISDTISGIALEGLSVGINSITSAIVFGLIVVQTAIFAFVYIQRMLMVSFLIMISPIITITYSIDKMADRKAQALGEWLKNFVYSVIIQPFHCIIYVTFITVAFDILTTPKVTDTSSFIANMTESNRMADAFIVIMCIMFIKDAEKMVRKIFHVQTHGDIGSMAIGTAAAMLVAQKAASYAGKAKSITRGAQNMVKKLPTKMSSNGKGLAALGSKIGKNTRLGEGLTNFGNKLSERGKNLDERMKKISEKKNQVIGNAKAKMSNAVKTITGYNSKSGWGKMVRKIGDNAKKHDFRKYLKRSSAKAQGAFLSVAALAGGGNVFQALAVGKNFTNARMAQFPNTGKEARSTIDDSVNSQIEASESTTIEMMQDIVDAEENLEEVKNEEPKASASEEERAAYETKLRAAEQAVEDAKARRDAHNAEFGIEGDALDAQTALLTSMGALAIAKRKSDETAENLKIKEDEIRQKAAAYSRELRSNTSKRMIASKMKISTKSSSVDAKAREIVEKVRALLGEKATQEDVENFSSYLIAQADLNGFNNAYRKGKASFEDVSGLVQSTMGVNAKDAKALAYSLMDYQSYQTRNVASKAGFDVASQVAGSYTEEYGERTLDRLYGAYNPKENDIDLTNQNPDNVELNGTEKDDE